MQTNTHYELESIAPDDFSFVQDMRVDQMSLKSRKESLTSLHNLEMTIDVSTDGESPTQNFDEHDS